MNGLVTYLHLSGNEKTDVPVITAIIDTVYGSTKLTFGSSSFQIRHI